LKLFGTVNPPPLSVQGRRRILNREHEDAIENFLNEYSQAYLEEVAAFIYGEFSTLPRAMSRIKLTHKRVEPVSGAQDEDLRVSWMATISQYEAEHLVFLDETACNGMAARRINAGDGPHEVFPTKLNDLTTILRGGVYCRRYRWRAMSLSICFRAILRGRGSNLLFPVMFYPE
jgi:hypothetical protein